MPLFRRDNQWNNEPAEAQAAAESSVRPKEATNEQPNGPANQAQVSAEAASAESDASAGAVAPFEAPVPAEASEAPDAAHPLTRAEKHESKRTKRTRGKQDAATSGKRHRIKRKAGKNSVVRVEELEKALAEEGIDVDPEDVVSMYMPKRRMQRIGAALLRMGALQKALLCLALVFAVLFSLSFMQENMGNFTINLNRLELFRHGVAIADNAEFEGATARLTAEAVADGTNIAAEDLPNNLDEIDGSHNGKSYVAYTFYIRNAGKEDLYYNAKLKIVSASKGAEKAARVRVWRNGQPTTYAAPAANGGNEAGCENFAADDVVCNIANDDFKVGYVDKYTVVIWLDGDDPECVDDIIGGEVEFAMDFDADDENQTSLLAKFVQDIVDTLTGNDPISASGNDAPDYYQNHTVTWDDRRNQENPPA